MKLYGCCAKPSADQPTGTDCPGASKSQHVDLSLLQHIALVLLWGYKITLSPLLGSACKFHPSCSSYSQQAIEIHGVRKGCLLTLKRLLRCRPFSQGGFDPVPESIHPTNF